MAASPCAARRENMVEQSLMEPLLLVEDKTELRAMLRKALERAGHKVDEAPDGSAAVAKVRARRYLLVLTDLKLPGCSGLDVLRETKQADPTIPVILITAYGSVEEAVTAMKEGAYDFIQKPVDLEHLNLLVQRASQQQELLRENLLLRQSGTGKELFARAIHHLSPRNAQPFVALNCAAIPEGLVENELFGHERGAFTGAGSRKVGKMELANRGTIFLDEIAELPLATQAKLLRVLEERSFERVGGTQLVEIDVRILAATNKDLRDAVASKSFREELFFLVAAVPITIPPLRERGDDVLMLAEHFLERFRREFRKPNLKLSGSASAALRSYAWPGNVRELQNTIERAAILSDSETIDAENLQLPAPRPPDGQMPEGMLGRNFDWGGTLQDVGDRAVNHVERFKIEEALKSAKWNKTRAAELLGVSYKTLLNKIRLLGLEN